MMILVREKIPRSKDMFLGAMSFSAAELASQTAPPCGWFYLLDRERGEDENVPALALMAEFVQC